MIALLAAVRAVHLFSLMALWGGGAYHALLARSLGVTLDAGRLKRAAFILATLALITALAWFGLATGQISGDWRQAADPSALLAVARETSFGRIWVWRFLGLVLLWLMPWFKTPPALVVLLAGMVLASLGLTSHAAAAGGLVRAVNDGIHLLTAGFWIGSLLVLAALARIHRHERAMLAAPFRLFSAWGLYTVALLVVSGVINTASIMRLSGLSPQNAYADLLGVKIALALVMIAFAAVNRSQLLPALEHGEGGVLVRLRHNVAAELVLAVLVVAIVGYLGMISPS